MAKKNNDFSIDDLIDEYSSNGEMVMHSTGIRAFDQMMGGGLMEGAMYGFWGEQGTGKSSLCAQIARKFCEEGYTVLYIDSEKSLNDMQKKIYGLTEYCENKTLLHLDKVVTMKQCDEVCSKLIKANAVKLIIIDSETELLAKTADEIDVESKAIGEHARQSQVMLSKLKCGVHLNNLIAIVMFQARANIQTNPTYGASDKKQAGGYAGRHVPDAIIQIAKGMAIKDSENKKIGHIMRISCDKNKIAPPTTIEQNFIYGVGISNKAGVIDAALERGLIDISGHSYILGNGNKYVGKKALYDMTEEDYKFLDEMLNED
jgi:RecA/RadA recombinase